MPRVINENNVSREGSRAIKIKTIAARSSSVAPCKDALKCYTPSSSTGMSTYKKQWLLVTKTK